MWRKKKSRYLYCVHWSQKNSVLNDPNWMLGSAAGEKKKQQPVSEGLDFFKLIPPPCSHVTQTQRPLCVTLKISRAKANNGLKTAIEAGNFSWRNFINEAPTFRQPQWNVAFVSFFVLCSGTLMLQLDGFPTGDGVKVRKKTNHKQFSLLLFICCQMKHFLVLHPKEVTSCDRQPAGLAAPVRLLLPLPWRRLGPLPW